MRRLLGILVLAAAVPALVAVGLGAAGDGGSPYRVRATFDNVASAVPGEDVKVAGARVGRIESMDVTPQKKAEVTLEITDRRFTPFHRDARCTIRPQSLIGEKFVECQPGTAGAPPLRDGVLPLRNTSSPVDLDLVNDIMRLPYRQRLGILLDELGTGVAGRGRDLNDVIHRANPALRQTDRALAILARQNRVLAKLASDSDTALAPLARERKHVSGFVVQANRTAEATAERRGDIERSVERLPALLRELRPLMADLGGFADQAAPVARDLDRAAPDIDRLVEQLGPFSSAAIPSVKSLGRAAESGRPALIRAHPIVRDLRRFGRDARPVSQNLDRLTSSLDRTGGIERIMDYLFHQMTSINGFDGASHYLRAALLVNLCSNYATEPASTCESTFNPQAEGASAGTAAAARAGGSSGGAAPRLARLADLHRRSRGSVPPRGSVLAGLLGSGGSAADRERRQNVARIRHRAAGPSPALRGASDPMLEYLLGGDR